MSKHFPKFMVPLALLLALALIPSLPGGGPSAAAQTAPLLNEDSAIGPVERVSIGSTGNQSNGRSDLPSTTTDGRYVAFHSSATNLVPDDTNNDTDIFVHDRYAGTGVPETVRVSVNSAGGQADDDSQWGFIAAAGRYVVFESLATNLVTGDNNGLADIFVHDITGGQTTRISVSLTGGDSNGSSGRPTISADGRFIVFHSTADNLVEVDVNGVEDVFIHDRDTDQDGTFDEPDDVLTSLVSVDSSGIQGNAGSTFGHVSAGGLFVAFASYANNLVTGDNNDCLDIFVREVKAGQTERVSVSSKGLEANLAADAPYISAGGHYVSFHSKADNLTIGDENGRVDVFVHERQTGETKIVSRATDGAQGNRDSGWALMSEDGQYVVFTSRANNFAPNDQLSTFDVFLHNRVLGTTTILSATPDGYPGNRESVFGFISADGRQVVFESWADDLITGDTNNAGDIFAVERIEIPTGEPITQTIAFFDQAVTSGALIGVGPGTSAANRLDALRNMLATSLDLLKVGDIDGTIQQLQDAAIHADGQPLPPDFVEGAATGDLADHIKLSITSLAH